MGRILVIVAKDKRELYEYLRHSYRTGEARVILDRREGRRGSEFRGIDHRRQPDVNAEVVFRQEVQPRPVDRLGRPSLEVVFSDKTRQPRPWTSASLPWPGLAP